ncbi:MAG: IMPACT family protein [Deinococcales bacterium]
MHTTLLKPHQHSAVVKNSEFLAFAAPISDLEAARAFLEQLKKRYPDATHICWAYKLGQQYRFSDDGEPSGTAGAPIFRALETSGLEGVVVAVVRYYGGVNLGAGGLVRAYGGTAAECLRTAPKLEVHPRCKIEITVPFEMSSVLHRLLEKFDLEMRQDQYTAQGLQVSAALLESDLSTLQTELSNATRGQGKLYNTSCD